MILELIAAIGVSILFTENPQMTCGNAYSFGCYLPQKNEIHLSYYSKDINHSLYHELGHSIFYNDDYSRIIIKGYKPLQEYPSDYDTERKILDETVADYFAEFMLNNKEFSVKYPCLWLYFDEKINSYSAI